MCVCAQLFSHVRRFETPMDCSLPGYSFLGISQARTTGVGCYFLLQRLSLTQGSGGFFTTEPPGNLISPVACACMCVYLCCYCLVAKPCSTLLQNPWIVIPQAPLSMEHSRQECWSGLPFPSLEDLPNPGIEPVPPTLPGRFLTAESSGKPPVYLYTMLSVYGIWTFKSRFLSLFLSPSYFSSGVLLIVD